MKPSTTRVEPNLVRARRIALGERDEQPHAAERDEHAEQRRPSAEHQILDEQQPAEPRDAGAERGAHDELLLAAHAAHEREVHDVRAEMIITNAAAAMSSQSVSRARSPSTSLNGMTATR